ncbi:MAG: hypothetical protein HY552_07285 [Elusimicrobia bacterium]|nr:hypothetical protein [Elusimicrobiota bacterium]
MTDMRLSDLIRGKELHLRLRSNDLLESGRASLTAIGAGTGDASLVKDPVLESKEYTAYPPESIWTKIFRGLSGRMAASGERADVVVVVEEKNGSLSPDDVRYIEWLGRQKIGVPWVVMVPESGRHAEDHQVSAHALSEAEAKKLRAASFWRRQLRRLRALPAPITKDAALAAIPRTAIPVGFSVFLAYLKRGDIPLERSAVYIGLAFGFAVGFALFNQTVLNYITFCSEFTREAFEPWIRALDRVLSRGRGHWLARAFLGVLSFVSARGDVLIAGPSIGIICTYIARLALGPVGETVSVLTFYGFFLVVCNVVVGSFAGGPYAQVIAHLRAVGSISNRASMYLGIVETIKMELGRLADFGMQTLFNALQGALAVGFWLLLLVVDRCHRKPEVHCLKEKGEIDAVRKLFDALRDNGGRRGPSAAEPGLSGAGLAAPAGPVVRSPAA